MIVRYPTDFSISINRVSTPEARPSCIASKSLVTRVRIVPMGWVSK